jgi:predicted outer membrane repeat protein
MGGTFTANTASYTGGAIAVWSTMVATFTGAVFDGNDVSWFAYEGMAELHCAADALGTSYWIIEIGKVF